MGRFTEAKTATRVGIEARIPILLWGPPGVGKTAVVEQIASELDAGYVPIAVATRLAEDFSGLPVPREDGVVQEPLSWVRRAISLANERKGGCIVLLDEFSCAPGATQAALLSLVQSRYCGETEIPREVAFVAAANPIDQAADGWELPAPTVSRWIHLDWPSPTVEEWVKWLTTSSVRPEDRNTAWSKKPGQQARALVSGYLMRSPSSLNGKVPAGTSNRAEPYPCSRSWEHAARLMAVAPDELTRDMLVAGAVGNGVAAEFAGWLREADLPNPEELLKDPDAWVAPKGRADRVVATLLSVVGALERNATQDRYDGTLAICLAAKDQGFPGAAVIAVSAALSTKAVSHLDTPSRLREMSEVATVAESLGLFK